MNEPNLRVVIADDQPDTLRLIRRILEPEFKVVQAVFDGRQLIEAVEQAEPEVVITDLSMPEMSGIEAIEKLRASDNQTPAVVLSAHNDPRMVAAALAKGAKGYVLKRRAPMDLRPAVEAVADGREFLSQGLTAAPDDSD